ncbi:MAG: type II toxin-antitoxin system Phd/YefM family antitoxin [Bryobacteraceae bacterium]
MEVGIRNAKSNLSRLVEAVLDGEEVFLTNRGERVAQLVAAPKPKHAHRGRGLWKEKANLYSGWDSPKADKDIEEMFENVS